MTHILQEQHIFYLCSSVLSMWILYFIYHLVYVVCVCCVWRFQATVTLNFPWRSIKYTSIYLSNKYKRVPTDFVRTPNDSDSGSGQRALTRCIEVWLTFREQREPVESFLQAQTLGRTQRLPYRQTCWQWAGRPGKGPGCKGQFLLGIYK